MFATADFSKIRQWKFFFFNFITETQKTKLELNTNRTSLGEEINKPWNN